jgi:hypothetical protein
VKQHFTISSPNTEEAAQQVLAIRLGEQHFGFAISNPVSGELLQLAWYDSEQVSSEALEDIYQKHSELKNSFYKTIVAYDHPLSILTPSGLAVQKNPKQLLETMYGINGKQTIITENVNGWQLQNIYAVPVDTREWMIRHFPAAEYWHNYSVGIRQVNATDFEGNLIVDFRANDFAVVVSKGNKLLLAQTFQYGSPADVIYNLVKICSEFSLERESVKLTVSGLIAKESALYRELLHYFVALSLREPGWKIPEEQDYPAHFFTSLNDLAVCAS